MYFMNLLTRVKRPHSNVWRASLIGFVVNPILKRQYFLSPIWVDEANKKKWKKLKLTSGECSNILRI